MENQKTKKTLAIIGAGPSGLITAKIAKERNFDVTIFEKKGDLGGLWSNSGFTWDSMKTNNCKYTFEISDFKWEEDSPVYPSAKEVVIYLGKYTQKFELYENILFNSSVLNISRFKKDNQTGEDEDKYWLVEWLNTTDNLVYKSTFDFIIICSGFYSVPNWGNYLSFLEDKTNDKLQIIHSSTHRNEEAYKNKKVIIVGNSFSSSQISSEVAKTADSVINIFKRTPMCLNRWVYNTFYGKNSPLDTILFSRHFAKPGRGEENIKNTIYRQNKICACMTNQNEICKELYIDPESDRKHGFLLEDNYLKDVQVGSIKLVKSSIIEIKNNRVYLENKEEYPVDILLLATGFKTKLDLIDEEILKELEFDQNDDLVPIMLYNHTFNPNVKNIAFVGVSKGLFFGSIELQAKYAISFLLNKLDFDDNKINNSNGKLRGIRNLPPCERPQYAIEPHVVFCDILADELGILPNLEKIQNEDEELYNCLVYGPLIASHYLLNDQNEDIRNNAALYIKKVNSTFQK